MEDLMDDELQEAMDMTKEELLARRDAGQPAQVRKREDFSQRMHRVVAEAAERSEREDELVLYVSVAQGLGNRANTAPVTSEALSGSR
jgi:hypothetical protein